MKRSAYITRLCRRIGRTRVFRITAALVAILQVTVSFLSCTGKEKPLPVDIVRALVDAEVCLPSGALYFSEAPIGSPEYLPTELLLSAYGLGIDLDEIESAAIRLSSGGHPCEFSVFLCKSSNAALDNAMFFRQRLDDLKKSASISSKKCGMTKDEYLEYLSDALIITSGRYVALIISSDHPYAERIFRRLT